MFVYVQVRPKFQENKSEAKLEFRSCMARLSKDLKLYKISPQVNIHIYANCIFAHIKSFAKPESVIRFQHLNNTVHN